MRFDEEILATNVFLLSPDSKGGNITFRMSVMEKH